MKAHGRQPEGWLPANTKPIVIDNHHYKSMDEAARLLSLSPSTATRLSKLELPMPDGLEREEKEAHRKKQIKIKERILVEMARDALKLIKMRQDFALGLYSGRQP
jgi:hypothetical protein